MNQLVRALSICLVFLSSNVEAFRCQHEKELDAKTNKTEFAIKPQKSLDGEFLWVPVSSMNIFLFGNIERKHHAKIQAGFYNVKTGALIYKVVICCENGGTWKTMYDKNGGGKLKKWKSGKLEGGCQKGEFDLIGYVGCPERTDFEDVGLQLPCAKMAYFVFNGQVLEDNLQIVPRYGSEYMEPLPVSIRSGKRFKAEVLRDGATFTQQAYGKCFEFPSRLHNNCTAAQWWILGRSDSLVLGLKDMGLWSMGHNVECATSNPEDPNHVFFKTLQRKIVPDGSAIYANRGFATCCCSYMDGYVGSEEYCLNNFVDHQNCNMHPRPGYPTNEGRCDSFKAVFAKADEIDA